MKAGREALQAALQDKEESVRETAFKVLADADRIADPTVLLEALPDYSTREAAKKAFGRFKDRDRAVTVLTGALRSHAKKEVREQCAEALGGMKAGREALRAALTDKEQAVRTEAMKALAAVSTGQDVEFFVDLLKNSPHEDIRSAAMDALRILGDPKGLPPLLDALGNDSLRYAASAALKGFPQRLVMVLAVSVAARTHKDAKVRRACVELLVAEVAEASANVFAEALKDDDKEVRRAAAQALRKGVRYRHIPALLRGLGDADEQVRGAAVETLAACEDFADPAPLLQMLKDSSASCRSKAVEALGQLRQAAAIPALVSALADPATASEAQKALGKIADPVAVATALSGPLAAHKDVAVRTACVKVLGELDVEPAVPLLERAARDPDAGVAKAAAEALKKYTAE